MLEHWARAVIRGGAEELDQPLTRRDFLRFQLDRKFDNFSAVLLLTASVALSCVVGGGVGFLPGDQDSWMVLGFGIGSALATWMLFREQREVWRSRYRLELNEEEPP